jgi:DNA-binding NarL/FixJ family response regulator
MSSVLIVNNNAAFLDKLTVIFKNSGYHVIATDNSLTTLDLFNKYKPCAVIIDIYMNGKDGFEVIKEIRAVCQKTFILVISAREYYLDSITFLGADLAISSATPPELMVNAVAVAEKEQLLLQYASLPKKYQRKKNVLKLA